MIFGYKYKSSKIIGSTFALGMCLWAELDENMKGPEKYGRAYVCDKEKNS